MRKTRPQKVMGKESTGGWGAGGSNWGCGESRAGLFSGWSYSLSGLCEVSGEISWHDAGGESWDILDWTHVKGRIFLRPGRNGMWHWLLCWSALLLALKEVSHPCQCSISTNYLKRYNLWPPSTRRKGRDLTNSHRHRYRLCTFRHIK